MGALDHPTCRLAPTAPPLRLLDLFCGAGGAARGYQQVGFHVTGVDNRPQPHYCGDAFVQADALEYLAEHGGEYDAIHASPPCQGYSILRNLPWLREKEYPLLILPTIELLEEIARPYTLENVMGAQHSAPGLQKRGLEAHGLQAGWLCGTMFGRPFYRHRLMATNWPWLMPGHSAHASVISAGRNLGDRAARIVYHRPDGSVSSLNLVREAMEIDWPCTRDELTQMVPPCYTRYLGGRLLEVLGA